MIVSLWPINEVTTMDAKTAVDLAKRHAGLFSKENVSNLGLEEVDYDDAGSSGASLSASRARGIIQQSEP
jgi:hypothetical protein